MADNVVVTAGTGTTVAADEVVDATLGTVKVQYVKLMDGTLDGDSKAAVSAAGLKVDLGADNDVVVSATNLDIRDLTNTDVVTAELSAVDNAVLDTIAAKDFATQTTLAAMNAKMVTGTDIGDVTINNAAGAAAVNIQDGGNTITVDGTVAVTNAGLTEVAAAINASSQMDVNLAANGIGIATSAKQDTIIGHLDGVETTLTAIDGRVDGVEALLTTIDSDTSNLAVVGGGTEATAIRVTIANNSTGVLSVDDNGGALTVDGTVTAELSAVDNAVLDTIDAVLDTIKTDTAAVVTAVQTLDNAISGSEMQVDVVAALPAGTNSLGKLLPPDVDVTAHTNYARKYYTSAGAATDGIIWSPAAGKRWHVVALYFQVSATATVTFEDDKSGGDDPVLKGEYAANSGAFLTFPDKYPMASGEDAADLTVTTSAGNIYVMAIGYEI